MSGLENRHEKLSQRVVEALSTVPSIQQVLSSQNTKPRGPDCLYLSSTHTDWELITKPPQEVAGNGFGGKGSSQEGIGAAVLKSKC